MQTIFNEPYIRNFLATVNEEQQMSTLKELILIGINVVSSRIHKNLQQKQNYHINQVRNDSEVDIVKELQFMKRRIDELSEVVMKKSRRIDEDPQMKKTITFQEKNPPQKTIQVHHIENQQLKKQDIKITPKVTQTVPQGESAATNSRCKSRHHLDDSEVRKVLMNPFTKESPNLKKKKKKMDKKFQYQEEINKEQLRMIKSIHCEEEAINRSRRSRTAQNQFKAQSKIKNLIVQDKVKHKRTQLPGYDYDKYEYSDDEEESMNENNALNESQIESEESKEYEYSSFREQKQKKDEFDVVSNSSSFSKFSLGSQREAGKISNRKKKQ